METFTSFCATMLSDAANFFTKRSGMYPFPGRDDYTLPHRFNQFGGFVGGPVVLPHLYNGKDETFFLWL